MGNSDSDYIRGSTDMCPTYFRAVKMPYSGQKLHNAGNNSIGKSHGCGGNHTVGGIPVVHRISKTCHNFVAHTDSTPFGKLFTCAHGI